MIDTMHELQDELRNKFDIGVKNQQLISSDELVISGRDDKMLEVLDYLATKCSARLVHQVVNDFETRMELIDVLFMNHLRARVYVKIDIDSRDKKITTIADMFPAAKWLEKYQSQFLELDFVPRQIHQAENPPATKGDAGLPWVNIQVDDIVDKSKLLGAPGILDPKLDIASYTWVKTQQTVITSTRCQLGHFHRGIVKFAENVPVSDLPFVIARSCWKDRFHALTALAIVMERLNGIDGKVPLNATYWRAFACELERVRNHHEFLISWLQLAGNRQAVQENKLIIQELEAIEKSLVDEQSKTPFIVPGGILVDPVAIGRITRPAIENALRKYEANFSDYFLAPMNDRGLFDAYAGVGKIGKAAALAAGLNGPFLRACGVPFDTRVDFPWGPYKQGLLRWDTCTSLDGDVRARIEIHAYEIIQSLRIMYQLLALLAETPVAEASNVDAGKIVAGAEGFAVVESSSGDLHLYVKGSKDGSKLNTIRIQAPSYLNFTALETIIGTANLRMYPYIVHSVNPCWTCIDM
nr:NADH-quinone oxidoreductase subunit C [Candidatus Sigynarchaeota archaeon]